MNQGPDGSHSRCVQLSVSSPSDAGSAFNARAASRSASSRCRAARHCCPATASSGYFVLYQRWYKNEGKMEPGVKYCWPFWYRVSPW